MTPAESNAPVPTVIVQPNRDLTAAAIAARLGDLVVALTSEPHSEPSVHICVTGGGLGGAIWPLLAADPGWQDVHVWFSDERFLPMGDPERNDTAVLTAADRLGLPVRGIHSVAGPDTVPDATSAAWAYAADLATWARLTGSAGDVPAPLFAVSLLGMGPDGHVASLFPGRPEVTVAAATVVPVTASPKPPPIRVSFTRRLIEHCQRLWLIAAGADKAPAARRALADDTPLATPAAGLRGRDETLWLVDQTLAAGLSRLPD